MRKLYNLVGQQGGEISMVSLLLDKMQISIGSIYQL